eukprot:m51a1_g9579 putative rab family gtpase (207) ;mRNA; r:979894-981101
MGNRCSGANKSPSSADTPRRRSLKFAPTGRPQDDRAALAHGVKLVLVGDMSTGKTSIILRLVNNTFTGKTEATIGGSFITHKIKVGERVVKLDIWDTAGQERYRGLVPLFFRGAKAAIIVYDITNRESFKTMREWMKQLDKVSVLAIVGNKTDLGDQRVVALSEAQDFAREVEERCGTKPIVSECSAKSGEGVATLFTQICENLAA